MKNLLIIIVLAGAVAGVIALSGDKNTNVAETQIKNGQEAIEKIEEIKELSMDRNELILETIESNEEQEPSTSNVPGRLVKYQDSNIAETEGNIVLAFLAGWCPSCNAFSKDIANSLDQIPSNLTVIDVDYDEEKDLKKKYKISSQHTFVQVDNSGTEIKRWFGGNTLKSVVSKLE